VTVNNTKRDNIIKTSTNTPTYTVGPEDIPILNHEKMEQLPPPFIAPINSFDDSSRDIRLLPREYLDLWPSLKE
jgi:hypothetical protein